MGQNTSKLHFLLKSHWQWIVAQDGDIILFLRMSLVVVYASTIWESHTHAHRTKQKCFTESSKTKQKNKIKKCSWEGRMLGYIHESSMREEIRGGCDHILLYACMKCLVKITRKNENVLYIHNGILGRCQEK